MKQGSKLRYYSIWLEVPTILSTFYSVFIYLVYWTMAIT